jgi:hypothetical protein
MRVRGQRAERRLVASSVILVLLGVLACKRTERGPGGTTSSGAAPTGTTPPSAALIATATDAASAPRVEHDYEAELPADLRAPAPWGNDVRKATCGPRKDCRVLRERPAGSVSGADLVVVSVVVEPGDADASVEEDAMAMEVREHWVLGKKGSTLAFRARIAQEWVDPKTPLDDTLSIDKGTLTTKIVAWPTSAWQSWPERTFRLWPPALLALQEMPHHRGGLPVSGSTRVDFVAGSGHADFHCEAREGKYLPIPSVAAASGLDPSRGLGRCAADVDGTADHGWMASGTADAKSASMRLAKLGDALWIEVHDDDWTPEDALELSTDRPAGFMGCLDEELHAPSVHTIDPTGVVRSKGGGAPLVVRRARAEGDVRVFEIRAKDLNGIAVLFHDRDGARPARTIATVPPTSKELGDFAWPADVACADMADGPALVPMIAPRP